jgi:aldose 1-epimerase
MGAHPYITVGSQRIDADFLTVPAESYFSTDARGLPTGKHPVDGTGYDFRQPRTLGVTDIDHAFTALRRDADERARVELRAPDGSRHAALWFDSSFAFVQLYTGHSLPEPSRRRRSIAIEPMTCAPNAFRTGDGLIMLAAGERWAGEWGIET